MAPRWAVLVTYGLPSSSTRSHRLESTDKCVHIDKKGAAAIITVFNVRVRADCSASFSCTRLCLCGDGRGEETTQRL